MSDNGPVASSPIASLTPEESARKFDIMEGIRAIPVEDLPMRLKPLAECLMSHASYGQGKSYPAYGTLAKEVGCSRRYILKMIPELVSLGWFVCVGRRTDKKNLGQLEYVPTARMIEYLREYLNKKVSRSPLKRGLLQSLETDTQCSPGRDTQCSPPPDTQCSPPPDTQCSPNPVSEPADKPVRETALELESGGRIAPGLAPGRLAAGKNNPSKQYRDLDKIHVDEWTHDENDTIYQASMISNDFSHELAAQWPEVMRAANGNTELIREVISYVGRKDENPKPGQEILDHWSFFMKIVRERSRRRRPAGGKKTVETAPAAPAPAPTPVRDLRAEQRNEGCVREKVDERAKQYRDEGKDWVNIWNLIQKEMSNCDQYFGMSSDEIAKRDKWIYDEVNYLCGKENPEDDEDEGNSA